MFWCRSRAALLRARGARPGAGGAGARSRRARAQPLGAALFRMKPRFHPASASSESKRGARKRRCVERVLREVAQRGAELMVASHNQASVAAAAGAMRRLGLDPATSGAAQTLRGSSGPSVKL